MMDVVRLLVLCLLAAFEPQTFHSKLDSVTIPCTVVDVGGHPVTGLTRHDFRVYDNGVRRRIDNLWFDTDKPLVLAIIIDASESQREKLVEHRQTVRDLSARLIKSGDRSFVISVGNEGTSPLWDAIHDTAHSKLQSLQGTKALLILTDGFDTGSVHTWGQAADEAHKAGATLYTIQYRSSLGGGYAPDFLRMIDEAGGAVFTPPHGNYDEIICRLETDLRRRYVLGFQPDAVSAKLRHEVRVEVNRPELTVRARKTYFSLPQ
jgi:hypothetical protein